MTTYRRIQVRPLAGALGAHRQRRRSARPRRRQLRRDPRRLARSRSAVLPRSGSFARSAQGLRAPLRHAAGAPVPALACGGRSSRDRGAREQREDAGRRGGLAHRRDLLGDAADGVDPARCRGSRVRRRHDVDQLHARLRRALLEDEAPARRPHGDPRHLEDLLAGRVSEQEPPRRRQGSDRRTSRSCARIPRPARSRSS